MLRGELLGQLAVTLAGGVARDTTAAGSTTTAVDTLLARYPDDWFIGWELYFTEGTLAGVTVIVTDFVSSTGTLTFATQAGAPGSAVGYVLVKDATVDFLKRVITDSYHELKDDYLLPYFNEEIALDDATFDYDVPYAHEVDGTADSGNAGGTTLVDSALTQADDYWLGSIVAVTSGAQGGEWRTVTDFVASTDTLTVEVPFSAQITTNTYTLYKPRPVSIHALYYLDSDGEYQEIPYTSWEITHRGGAPQLHFYNFNYTDRTLRGRVWGIVDGRTLRIVGMRHPIEPQSDFDPIELPQQVMLAWCRYFFHANLATNASIDPRNHLQQVQLSFQVAQQQRDANRVGYPPNSRKVLS